MRGRSRSYGFARYRRGAGQPPCAGRRGDRNGDPHDKELEGGMEHEGPCIWIGGCPDDVSEREVERVCAKFGMVHGISIRNSDRETFALVWYARASHARDAIYGLDQTAPFGSGAVSVEPAAGRHRDTRGGRAAGGGGNWDQWCPSAGGGAAGPRAEAGYRGRGGGGKYERSERERAGPGHRADMGNDRRDHRRNDCRRRGREESPPRQYAPRPVRVYLSQLPRDMEEDEFQEIVAEYGAILQYELHREGAYKCGWVEYASKAEAEAALSELDDRRMDDWNMRLQAYIYPGGGP